MYERSYGSKYAGFQTAADVAKQVRADIKAAQKAGDLPAMMKVSVTSESYSMGQSVDVKVLYDPSYWRDCDGVVPSTKVEHEGGGWSGRSCGWHGHEHGETHQALTAEAEGWWKTLRAIHGAYNHDGSEIQVDYFDVLYYGQVTMEDASSAEWRAKEKARQAAGRANAKAKGDLIDHLLAEHRPWGRYGPAKKGNLRLASYEKLVAAHDSLHAKEVAG